MGMEIWGRTVTGVDLASLELASNLIYIEAPPKHTKISAMLMWCLNFPFFVCLFNNCYFALPPIVFDPHDI